MLNGNSISSSNKIYSISDSISGSSANSAELTTIKDLKRSKNKGHKKKAKTKPSQTRLSKLIEPIQEVKPKPKSQDADTFTAPTLKLQNASATNSKKLENAATNVDETKKADVKITGAFFLPCKIWALIGIWKFRCKNTKLFCVAFISHSIEGDTSQKETISENKSINDHNAIPLNNSESMEDKNDQHLDEESSATDKSPDDLEVDNILSHSKVEPQNEHRTNLIVSFILANLTHLKSLITYLFCNKNVAIIDCTLNGLFFKLYCSKQTIEQRDCWVYCDFRPKIYSQNHLTLALPESDIFVGGNSTEN